jgi:hypothetical protein
VEAGSRIRSSVSVHAIQSKSSAVEILTTLAGIIEGHLQMLHAGDFCVQDPLCLVLSCQIPKQIDFNFVSRYNHIVWGRNDWEYGHVEGDPTG